MVISGCVSGPSRDPERYKPEIAEVMRSHIPQFQKCYYAMIEKRPGAHGKVIVEFVINSEGRATDVRFKEIHPSLVDGGECILENLRSFQFKKPPSGLDIEVSYPFFFSENGRF